MNIRSTLIASALVSALVATACGTDTPPPSSIGGFVPQQSAANDEEGLVLAARDVGAKAHPHSGGGGSHAQTRPHCQMSSDAVEQWLINGVVPRCQVEATPHHSHGGDRRTP